MTVGTRMTIDPGAVVVSAVDLLLDGEIVKIWHVDLATKYAEIIALSGAMVLLGRGERTIGLRGDNPDALTALVLDVPEDWSVLAECTRYTCRVVAYRQVEPVAVEAFGEQ